MSEKDPFNLPETEFDAVLAEIDQKLRQESDRVPGREMHGIAEFCAKFNVTLASFDPTTRRIIDWFKRMYGDRLSMDWDFGRSVVLVKGELCRIRGIPFFGSLPLVCSPVVMGCKLQEATPRGHIPVLNLLENQVQGLTPEMARRLCSDECGAILKAFGRMFLTFSRLEASLGARYGKSDAPYVKEAMHDLVGSTESLLTTPPNYGQSKWASLQAVEKVVKSCILEKGAAHKKSHSLADLCREAAAVGVSAVDAALIASIQCSPDVRYDSTLVSKADAVEAHYSALTVCGELAPMVRRTNAQSTVGEYKYRISSKLVLDGLILGYVSPAPPFTA